MNYQPLSDEILVKLIKISDDKALAEIYRRYAKTVFNSSYYRVRSKETAQELVQNLFLRLWEKRESIVIQNLQGYLQTAIKNSVINYFESKVVERKYNSFSQHQASALAENSDSTLLLKELNEAIEKAIQQLPEKTQQIFRLSRYEHLSAKEIAQNMGLTEKAVEYHITKSLKVVRLQLKELVLFLLLLINT